MIKFVLKSCFLITLFFKPLNSLGMGLLTSYFDEVVCLLAILYFLYKRSISSGYFGLVLVFVGLNGVNSALSELQFDIVRFTLDCFLFLKPILFVMFLTSIGSRLFAGSSSFFTIVSRMYLVLAFLFLPFHYVFPPIDYNDARFGINAYHFIASNAGDFTNMLLITTLIASTKMSKRSTSIYSIIGIVLMLSTLRFKAFVLVAAYMIFLNNNITAIFFDYFKRKYEEKKLFAFKNIFFLAPFGIVILAPGYSQFVAYFLSGDTTPRLLLTLEGVNIFLENFPFGIGPGFYGSAASSMFYSPVYVDLGWSNHWGLGKSPETNFLNDSFWPMVIAQYGFLGLMTTLAMYRKFIYSYLSFNTVHSFRYSVITVISLFLSTLGSSIFIGHIGLFYILGRFVLDNVPVRSEPFLDTNI